MERICMNENCGGILEERDSLNNDFFVGHCPKCALNYVISYLDEEEIENLEENGYEFEYELQCSDCGYKTNYDGDNKGIVCPDCKRGILHKFNEE